MRNGTLYGIILRITFSKIDGMFSCRTQADVINFKALPPKLIYCSYYQSTSRDKHFKVIVSNTLPILR